MKTREKIMLRQIIKNSARMYFSFFDDKNNNSDVKNKIRSTRNLKATPVIVTIPSYAKVRTQQSASTTVLNSKNINLNH